MFQPREQRKEINMDIFICLTFFDWKGTESQSRIGEV